MNLARSSLAFLLASSSISSVSAGPNGASACTAGAASPGGVHLSRILTTGLLSDGLITVELNGAPLLDGIPLTVPDLMFDVVVASDSVFKGILFRASNTDSSEVIPGGDLAVANACAGAVGSATHTSNADKTSATASFDLTDTGPRTIDLDINVVIENTGDTSTFYYSSFQVIVEPIDVVVTGTESPTVTPAVATTDVPTAMPIITNTVVDVVVRETDLTTLTAAVGLVNLASTLSAANTAFTVFAPTDTALEPLDGKFLTPEWSAHLDHILKLHYTKAGAVEASMLINGQTILMENGESITASVAGGVVSFSGTSFPLSTVVVADLIGDNGVVHKVDTFFMPTALTINLLQLAGTNPAFSQVSQLLVTSGLSSELEADERTIFVPSDTAFADIPQTFFESVAEDGSLLTELLSNHICIGVWPESLLEDGTVITTLNDKTVTIKKTGGGRFADYDANGYAVMVRNQLASNGLAHIINGVILNDAVPTTAPAPIATLSPDSTTAPVMAPTSGSGMVAVSTFMLVAATFFAQVV